jgi:hypothetical protein
VLSVCQRRSRRWRRTLLLVFAASFALSTAAFAADAQRMALAPSGCHILAPGGDEEVDAYCLDQSREPPAVDAVLSNVLPALDAATVKPAGAPALTLSQALAQHVIEIVGRASDRTLRIKNMTNRAVEICVTGPTVVMGAPKCVGGTEMADVKLCKQ